MKREVRPPLIVFVCEHGSAKSLVAASFCARLAKRRGIALRAVSRGTSPDPSVPASVVEALREDGFDVAAFEPQALNDPDVSAAARVVAIGVNIAGLGAGAGARLERWDDIPPLSESYAKARKVILSRMSVLLRDIERQVREDGQGAPRG
jgi:hypothetical protein